MQPLLSGKIALITGASRGLGLAIALRFAREGASLGVLARDMAALDAAVAGLRAAAVNPQQRFHALRADLRDTEQVERAAGEFLLRMGGVDILVNNAAMQGPIGSLEASDWQQWRSAVQVNLFAPARLCQLMAPMMRLRGSGKIINISGGGAASARPGFSAYASSKCALVRLTETLAEELKEDRIEVNAVAPGAMNTRMLDEVLEAGPDAAPREFASAVKRKQQGGAAPEDAARLVAMLASSQSDGITGKLISAQWDDWEHLPERREELMRSDLYTLRRVTRAEKPVPQMTMDLPAPRKSA